MSLPNPDMDFTALTQLPATDLDKIVENVEALADGSGLDDGAVGPAKRSGGKKVGVITGSTLGTTGNKAITGIGFKPSVVYFFVLPGSNAGFDTYGSGVMDESGNQFVCATTSGSSGSSRNSLTNACIGWLASGSTSWSLKASYVSMDADGFTINVTTATSTDVGYIAER